MKELARENAKLERLMAELFLERAVSEGCGQGNVP
jgi:hypothetical protein